MRVIAGGLRGRRLKAPAGTVTRPTSDRVREALFSMLGPIAETRVLDLFAGTGALGIEALSRGAQRALLVERDAHAIAVIKANLSALGIAGEQAQVMHADVLEALGTARDRHETYDLVFIDPPYRQAREYAQTLPAALQPLLAAPARVVVESDRRDPLELELPLQRERRYGDTLIRIHSPS
ncbi:MAG TPA: 16S rRNA (guanine(966)-N(2))-methyltransferase RsmD [Solirubrobacteraceae bacterium]